MATSTPTITWIWDNQHSLYYSPESGTYAYPDPNTGQWNYIPASSLASSSTSTEPTTNPVPEKATDEVKEDGEIEDDVGWGGLMEPEELDRALQSKNNANKGKLIEPSTSHQEKHPAYGNFTNPYPSQPASPSPTPETPNHLLRLVVLSSPSLPEGHVAIIDAREGGIQLGRDRPENGGHPKVRVKEMEVSKVHAVIYWGLGGDGEEDWWVVDLGSTHGTFVVSPRDDPKKGHRLSIPKTSSLPYPLSHLSTLTIGQTIFEIHNHPSWPCDECQLGRNNEIPIDTGEPPATATAAAAIAQTTTNGHAMNSSEKRENREVKRKREMAALKDSLLNKSSTSTSTSATHDRDEGEKRQYIDRSAIRRRLHPKSPPKANTAARLPPSIPNPPPDPEPVSSFAQNMMAAQGYTPGAGLGKERSGRSEAIEVKMRVEKRGLGAKGAEVPVEDRQDGGKEGDWRKKGRTRRFDEVKEW